MVEGRRIAIGESNFEILLEKECYYIDKTLYISLFLKGSLIKIIL